MKYLIIGGCRFLGAKVAEKLVENDLEVVTYDSVPPPKILASRIEHIPAVAGGLSEAIGAIRAVKPAVVVHTQIYREADAELAMELFSGLSEALIVASSANVYRAHARFHGTEPGLPDETPLAEASVLRARGLDDGEDSDKLFVERALERSRIPTTLLRLPPIYGPGDPRRRLYPLLVRMFDGRPHILLGERQAGWRWTHGYLDNVAHAVAFAAIEAKQGRHVYNVGELNTPTFRERIDHLATIQGWEGCTIVLPEEELPRYMRTPGDFDQDLVYSTSKIRSELFVRDEVDYYDGLYESVEWYRDNPPPRLQGKTFDYSAEDRVVADRIAV